MSLLDDGTEQVIVYPEVTVTDPDGNTIVRPADTGVPCRASVQPVSADELLALGQSTRTRYRLRLANGSRVELGAHAAVEWRGHRWGIEGDPKRHVTGHVTRHATAVIQRS